ncbi:nucleoside diphosphate-linked moiety X motif 19 isoform X2 [Drosophila obscura]|uniref:nucleoside diphosphate-linked moiety X motif 19 isoform X2 n=1 Tax=Drosophila obscura TaxID=7282 RepID=UPI000BA17B61|nr:nucleoside diphosphate-linked moiety X motif 19 isoform X2 [Drosophila obscura]
MEITLRLTALRECFEEVGILLCRSKNELDFGNVALPKELPDREAWQRRVHNKPSEFLNLCLELKVVPDLWALHEWSAWASPPIVRKGYETVFFIAFVDTRPSLLDEPSEVKESLWLTPMEFLRLNKLGDLWFLPPQFYELSRLAGVGVYESLLGFATKRSRMGTTMFMPLVYACEGSMVYVLPGDDYYLPEPQHVDEIISFPGSVDEFGARSKHLHRYTFGALVQNLEINIPPPNGHLRPQRVVNERQKL